jgi:hypothetical protein
MYRALPLAIGVTTFQASVGLLRRLLEVELAVDLGEFLDPVGYGFFRGVAAFYIEKLEYITHGA